MNIGWIFGKIVYVNLKNNTLNLNNNNDGNFYEIVVNEDNIYL